MHRDNSNGGLAEHLWSCGDEIKVSDLLFVDQMFTCSVKRGTDAMPLSIPCHVQLEVLPESICNA